ncbi:MAG: GNAT family N-acetyltransferase [Bacteroidales bacterium]
MTDVLTLRPARESDIPAIWRVHTRAVGETCRQRYDGAVIDAWVERLKPESYGAVLRRATVLVAEAGGQVVAFAQVDFGEAEVQAVYVLPEMEGRGLGSLLLSAVERAAADRGLTHLTLKATLNAEAFYVRHGWHPVRHDIHKITEQISLMAVAMEKTIAPRPEPATPLRD